MKNIVCVFAHPDDEAFGPSGTIAKFAEANNVFIICVTDGKNGQGSRYKNLSKVRRKELLLSARILAVKKVYFLGFYDGDLNNNLYHKIVKKIEKVVKKLKPETIITFEPRGVSGHVDHFVTTMTTTYVFKRNSFVKKLLYFCIDEKERKLIGNYFIYFPPGYKKKEIDLSIDVSKYWDKKVKSIKAHKSQHKDGEEVLSIVSKLPKKEHFLVLENSSSNLV